MRSRLFFLTFVLSVSLGSSPIFLIFMFVMCITCLVGAALMTFKKSRDKSAGYAVLVSEDHDWKDSWWIQLDWS